MRHGQNGGYGVLMSATTLRIDRQARAQSGATIREAMGIALLRLAYWASTPIGHLGISRVSRLVGGMFLTRGETAFVLNPQTTFLTPSGDYYWSLLYNYGYEYEPELELVFHAFRDLDYALIDLGANYGYWSILVSSPEFGNKAVVAVEASVTSFGLLEENVAQRSALIAAHHGAIWNVSGEELSFFGTRHAGRSLVKGWAGSEQVERVHTITVADLVSRYADRIGNHRLVLKLDVEGVEIAALEGAAAVLDRIDAIIFEEVNNQRYGETFLKLRELTGFEIFAFDEQKRTFGTIESPFTLFDPKKGMLPLQNFGFNFVAVRPSSPFASAVKTAR